MKGSGSNVSRVGISDGTNDPHHSTCYTVYSLTSDGSNSISVTGSLIADTNSPTSEDLVLTLMFSMGTR